MAGYSGTPLVKKLGIKPTYKVYMNNAPENYFDWISPLPDKVVVLSRLQKECDFIHLFVTRNISFQQLFLKSKKYLKKEGMLWISWPKKASKQSTDLDENVIRKFGLENGMVDVKVCAVDDVWSGLKFMFRIIDR